MPQYLYKCPYCDHEREIIHSMDSTAVIQCESCLAFGMNKKPQSIEVVWNGNKPSDGGVTQLVSNMIADAPQRRDELAAHKELSDGS